VVPRSEHTKHLLEQQNVSLARCIYFPLGSRLAFEALGKAIAEDGYNLVYGGGAMGIMGVVSGAVSDAGGFVTGIVPRGVLQPLVCLNQLLTKPLTAMVKAGGEGSQVDSGSVRLQANTDKVGVNTLINVQGFSLAVSSLQV